jgi:hypothetical protein
MDGAVSESCPVVGFGIGGVATVELVSSYANLQIQEMCTI